MRAKFPKLFTSLAEFEVESNQLNIFDLCGTGEHIKNRLASPASDSPLEGARPPVGVKTNGVERRAGKSLNIGVDLSCFSKEKGGIAKRRGGRLGNSRPGRVGHFDHDAMESRNAFGVKFDTDTSSGSILPCVEFNLPLR
jgi:hypothetical protein